MMKLHAAQRVRLLLETEVAVRAGNSHCGGSQRLYKTRDVKVASQNIA
ncbi:hypothetical protein [Pandoraea terrae]|nr:hypothetical protein [Pandoraea terrae]